MIPFRLLRIIFLAPNILFVILFRDNLTELSQILEMHLIDNLRCRTDTIHFRVINLGFKCTNSVDQFISNREKILILLILLRPNIICNIG